jgi:hypothetical protein
MISWRLDRGVEGVLMRTGFLAALAAVAVMAGAQGAVAKPVPEDGVTVEEFRQWLEQNGYKAQVEVEKDGSKHINSASDGLKFSIYFYDCKKDRCASIEYYLGFDKSENTPSLERINTWNREKRFLKAYLNEKGDAGFEYDDSVAPGGTWESIEDSFSVFLTFLPEVKKLMNW